MISVLLFLHPLYCVVLVGPVSCVSLLSPVEVTDQLTPPVNKRLFVNTAQRQAQAGRREHAKHMEQIEIGKASNSLDLNMIILFADIKDIFQRNTSMQWQMAVAKVIYGMKWSTDRQLVHMREGTSVGLASYLGLHVHVRQRRV